MQPCKWTCTVMGCNASCCTVSGCTLLERYMRRCSAVQTVCNVRECNSQVCCMLVCTVNCVCTSTPAHGSCTSSLRWLRLCLPPMLSAQEEGREKSKRTHQSNKRAVSFALCPWCPLLARFLALQLPAGVAPAVTANYFSNPLLHYDPVTFFQLVWSSFFFFFSLAVNFSQLNLK